MRQPEKLMTYHTLTVKLTDPIWRKLKYLAADKSTTLQKLTVQALQDYLMKSANSQ